MIPIVGCVVLAGVVTACSSDQNTTKLSKQSVPVPSAASVEVRKSHPVIGYLAGRDNTIIIKSGPNGPLYSVTAKDGRVLHRDLSAEQLQAKAPDIYRVINGSFANDARLLPTPQSLPVLDYDVLRPPR